jgi:hypothetical protein
MLSAVHLSLFNLCSSNLLGLRMFSAPVSGLQKSRMSFLSLASNMFEDQPQLCIQLYLARELNKFDQPLVLTSLCLSGFSLVFGVTRRCCVGLMNSVVLKASDDADGDGDGGNNGVNGQDRRLSADDIEMNTNTSSRRKSRSKSQSGRRKSKSGKRRSRSRSRRASLAIASFYDSSDGRDAAAAQRAADAEGEVSRLKAELSKMQGDNDELEKGKFAVQARRMSRSKLARGNIGPEAQAQKRRSRSRSRSRRRVQEAAMMTSDFGVTKL